jgi:hypothetical protein
MEEQLKSILKSKPKSKYQKEDLDSSDISSMDEDDIDMLTNQDIEKKATNTFVQNELLERITKYLKIDSKIKEKQKEVREYMKSMKEQKDSMEKYIIKYLEDVNEEFIKIDGEGKLVRTQTITRGAINNDNIKTSVGNSLKKENIKLDDKTFMNLIQTILEQVETNRPQKTRTYIKRTKETKKETTEAKKKEKVNNETKEIKVNNETKEKKVNNETMKKKEKKIREIESDDDIPKYI